MARIVTISVKSEDEWVYEKIKAMGGSMSGHVVQAMKNYVKDSEDVHGYLTKPEWYIDGADYSHLNIEERKKLVKFGYKDEEIGE